MTTLWRPSSRNPGLFGDDSLLPWLDGMRYLDIVDGIVIPERREVGSATKIPIDFSEELYEWVRETAHRQRRSMADLVREALREYREQQEPQLQLPIGRGPI